MDKSEVLKLAGLARIDIGEEEAKSLTHEFEAILNYVGEVKELAGGEEKEKESQNYPLKNIYREDANHHESGEYTEDLLSAAPSREGEYVKVKQILG